MNRHFRSFTALVVLCTIHSTIAESAGAPLIVVRDSGGVPAAPYYKAMSLQANGGGSIPASPTPIPQQVAPLPRAPESQALSVRSTRMTPGDVAPRPLNMPGLQPFFLVGDDDISRGWLARHIAELRELHAVGFVVEVQSIDALNSLRRQAYGVTLSPVSGDDIAQRLNLDHYPVLITATRLGP